jgi:predicted transcriptional regulator
MAVKKMKAATWREFKDFTLAVARGEKKVDPSMPKIWCVPVENAKRAPRAVQFRSLEAGAKLLSAKNLKLLRLIQERRPESVAALAAMTGRADENVLRTLNKFVDAGIVELRKGDGRALRPVLTTRKVLFEVDLVAGR